MFQINEEIYLGLAQNVTDRLYLKPFHKLHSEEEFRKQIIAFFEKGSILKGKTLIIQIDGSEESSRNLIESTR